MRNRAFTLIEMTVVCSVLLVFAALVTPQLAAMKASREKQNAYESLLRLAQRGRESALSDGQTYVLSIGNGGTQLILERTPATDTSNDPRMTSDNQDEELESVATENFPPDVQAGTIELAGEPSNASDFKVHFYPDGKSEGGGIELSEGDAVRSLTIDTSGQATFRDGNLPSTTGSRWEAGQYEQRSGS